METTARLAPTTPSPIMRHHQPEHVVRECEHQTEAALDDLNLSRLLTVFRELQDSSQLIVITHQKRTMEIADALYGVTMHGDGVSKVISQRIPTRPEE